MTALAFSRVIKDYGGLRPLRIADLAVDMRERVALAGLDVPAAETFLNLVTGSSLPDEGEVRVMGQPTSAITEADVWLASLDKFGVVTHRAVLLDPLTIAQNVAMSFSLSIEPVPPAIHAQVAALAEATGITQEQLEAQAGSVSGAVRVRAHLARALALDPSILVLEHPTLNVDAGDVPGLSASILRATADRDIAVLALTNDTMMSKGLGGRRLKVDPASGAIKRDSPFYRF